MEKHKCKVCLRKFDNGRALGGHVRSHKINLYPPPPSPSPKAKVQLQEMSSEEEDDDDEEEEGIDSCSQSSSSSSSFTSSSSSDDAEFEDEDHHKAEWKENLKNSSQENEEESTHESDESSRNHFFKTQSNKRIRSSRGAAHQVFFNKDSIFRQPFLGNGRKSGHQVLEKSPPLMESEPLSSSISETTQEEDIAYCLMMLSRDKWTKTEPIKKTESSESKDKDDENQCQEQEEEDYGATTKKVGKSNKGKYRCETCEKVFKSYQALGGHRASHKRIKLTTSASTTTEKKTQIAVDQQVKLHKCPVCFKVFPSGQALGGHKRSHGSSALRLLSSSSSGNNTNYYKGLIDLNLPAPIDDEDYEQISAVSEDEFVKLH